MTIKFKLKDVDKKPNWIAPWFGFIFYEPVSEFLTWVTANFTNLTPNQITYISFLTGLASAYCFLQGTYFYIIVGCIIFLFSYLLDWVDGRLARLKKVESNFGGYIDSMLDQFKFFIIVMFLVQGQYMIHKDILFFWFGSIFILLHLTHWINEYEINTVRSRFIKKGFVPNASIGNNKLHTIHKIKLYFDSRRISIMPTFVESDTVAFFIFPLLMQIKIGLIIASVILVLDILAKAVYFFAFTLPEMKNNTSNA